MAYRMCNPTLPGNFTTNAFTITLVRKHTNIPIPKVLDWSDDTNNEIGSEYIIMECVSGDLLAYRWLTMTDEEKINFVTNFHEATKDLPRFRFPGYGALYFRNRPLPAPHIVINDIDDEFSIGPHCGVRFWGCAESEHSISGGRPITVLVSYLLV